MTTEAVNTVLFAPPNPKVTPLLFENTTVESAGAVVPGTAMKLYASAEMTTELFDHPPEMFGPNDRFSVRASYVLLLDCPKVLPCAKTAPV